MGKLKLQIHPIYLIFVFISAYFGWLNQLIIYSIVLLFHEYAHFFVAAIFGYKFEKITFSFYGAQIKGKNNFMPKHEIIISLAGPILNIILAIIFVALWWMFPVIYSHTVFFVTANLYIAIFNLFPIFPLDAGRVLLNLLKNKTTKASAYKTMKVLSYICVVLFATLFVYSAFNDINLNLFFISIFLFLSISENTGDIYREYSSFHIGKYKALEVKTFIVHTDNLYKLIKYLSPKYYAQFLIVDENYKVINKLTQKDILALLKY